LAHSTSAILPDRKEGRFERRHPAMMRTPSPLLECTMCVGRRLRDVRLKLGFFGDLGMSSNERCMYTCTLLLSAGSGHRDRPGLDGDAYINIARSTDGALPESSSRPLLLTVNLLICAAKHDVESRHTGWREIEPQYSCRPRGHQSIDPYFNRA